MISNITLSKILKILLSLYIFSILFFDYTIIYKIIILIIFLILFFYMIRKKRKIRFTTLFISYFIFSIYCFLHTIFGLSVDFSLSINYCVTLLINSFIIFSITNIINNKKDINDLIKTFIFSSLICVIYAITYNLTSIGEFTTEIPYLIFSNITYNHNDIPIVAGFSIAFILYLFYEDKSKYKLYLLLIFLFSIVIILSGARKSFLLLIFIFIFYFIFNNKKNNIKKIILKIILVIFFCFIGYSLLINIDYLYYNIGYRFEDFFNGISGEEFEDGSSISRSMMLKTSIKLIMKKPFLGYGLFSFSTFPGSYGTWSHNNYLEIIVSGGVGLLFIYYYPYIKNLKRLIKSKIHNEKVLYICLLLFIIFIYDNLSVSFFSRLLLIIVTLIDSYCYLYLKNK